MLVVASLVACCGPIGAQDAAVEARIRRIESNILPSATAPGTVSPQLSLQARMAQLHTPGVSITVFRKGKIEWSRGFGVTRIGGPPVTPQTLFQAGSISKGVSAMGALRLAQAGKLDLDADVRGMLKGWRIPENKFSAGHKITLRQLLSHTAGMTAQGFAGYGAGQPIPTTIQILNGAAPANSEAVVPQSIPGTQYSYSGGGYVIAQKAMEDVTGTPFAQLMQRNLLTPLGMTASSFEQTLSPARQRLAATPYRGYGEPVRGGPHRYPEMAPAGLWTTPSDLARYAIALQQALAEKSGAILSPVLARAMTAPVASTKLTGMTVGGLPNGYGLGLVTAQTGKPFYWHNGQDEGFTSMLLLYGDGDGVVVMNNGDTGGDLGGDIVRTVAREYGWLYFQPRAVKAVALGPDALDRYIGHYRTKVGGLHVISRSGDRLLERHPGDGRNHLLPVGGDRFEASGWTGLSDAPSLQFRIGADGRATSLTWHQDGGERVAERIADDDPSAAHIDALLRRVDTQVADPNGKSALRDLITQMQSGRQDYKNVEAPLAARMKKESSNIQRDMKRLGLLRGVSFKMVEPAGNDIYETHFEHGWLLWRIGLSRTGKIRTASYSDN